MTVTVTGAASFVPARHDRAVAADQPARRLHAGAPGPGSDVTQYPIAELKDAPNLSAAAAFISYVLGPDGQKVLAGFSFMPPG